MPNFVLVAMGSKLVGIGMTPRGHPRARKHHITATPKARSDGLLATGVV